MSNLLKIVTSEEMQSLDRKTINELGIPGMVLMENAGRAVYERIIRRINRDSYVIILAGRGNNGGDGFVIARHLFNNGYKVRIFLIAKKEDLKGDALTNCFIAEKIDVPVKEIFSENELPFLSFEIDKGDLIVDGLLGTGIKGGARGLIAEVINIVNNTGKPVIAIDTPSGLDCTTGRVEGPCIKATETVTFCLPKRGMFIFPGGLYVGNLVVADISIPQDFWKKDKNLWTYLITSDMIRDNLPVRELDAYKGTCGRVLIVAGSPGFTGAAALSGESSLRTGAGLVTVAIPESLNDIMEIKLTEVMTKPLPETSAGTISLKAFDIISVISADAMAIGPGLSTDKETGELVRKLISLSELPLVIDADGLNLLSEDISVLEHRNYPVIITPHPGEMARLTGLTLTEIKADPVRIAAEFARKWNVYIILKFARSIIATPDGHIYFNPTGTPGMATGGSGDVLTGMVTSFLAQGLSPLYACLCGTYLHGLSGSLACKDLGEESLIAGDLIDYIPDAFGVIKSGCEPVEWISYM
ncbi:MAG: NAD(P)H-hydrate dehydratase [Candidatus Eremiobacterota bacterium]